ncbi:class I SAM-dependent methyltransferase [Candidatus Pelagibacter sp.]|jgi:SAM-dependent methyltransferase|nr:class I SAM-dependent methyltransferase [Candidatus Pelagibacter sp.]
MFKKKIFTRLTPEYNSHAYSGLMGFFMNRCHKQLEKFDFPNNISKVLEIGAGSAPHYKFIKHHYDEYHIAETSGDFTEKYIDNPKVIATKYNGKILPYEKEYFDRIIISHCLEHIMDPESFLHEMMKKLKIGGILSISLPTDPGLLFRLGRLYLKLFSIKKKYRITPVEFDYMNATEHVNSIFGLFSIIKYNFGDFISESYLPFKIKSFDLNLFYNVHITKKN